MQLLLTLKKFPANMPPRCHASACHADTWLGGYDNIRGGQRVWLQWTRFILLDSSFMRKGKVPQPLLLRQGMIGKQWRTPHPRRRQPPVCADTDAEDAAFCFAGSWGNRIHGDPAETACQTAGGTGQRKRDGLRRPTPCMLWSPLREVLMRGYAFQARWG